MLLHLGERARGTAGGAQGFQEKGRGGLHRKARVPHDPGRGGDARGRREPLRRNPEQGAGTERRDGKAHDRAQGTRRAHRH